jgi:hypothetical protein
VAVAGGLVAGVPALPAATASMAATSIITINATSPHYPGLKATDHGKVDGHAIVIYKATKKHRNTGVISGKVTTTAANDTATLLAEPFGAKRYTAVGSPVSLTNGAASYSFNVTPSLATPYKVKVAGTDKAVSGVVTVYVTEGARIAHIRAHCSSTSPVKCRFSFRLYVVMPASALKHEIGKHWYRYLGVGYPFPRLPKVRDAEQVRDGVQADEGQLWRVLPDVRVLLYPATRQPQPRSGRVLERH